MYLQLADKKKARVHGYFRKENFVPSHWRHLSDGDNPYGAFGQRVIASTPYLSQGHVAALAAIKNKILVFVANNLPWLLKQFGHFSQSQAFQIRQVKRDAAFLYFNTWLEQWHQILSGQYGEEVATIVTSIIYGTNLDYVNEPLLKVYNPYDAINRLVSLHYKSGTTGVIYTPATPGYKLTDYVTEMRRNKRTLGYTPLMAESFTLPGNNPVQSIFDGVINDAAPGATDPTKKSGLNLTSIGLVVAALSFFK